MLLTLFRLFKQAKRAMNLAWNTIIDIFHRVTVLQIATQQQGAKPAASVASTERLGRPVRHTTSRYWICWECVLQRILRSYLSNESVMSVEVLASAKEAIMI